MSGDFIIIDWAYNHLFPKKSFDTFEDGWDFIYEQFPNEECFDDVFVVSYSELKREGKRVGRYI